MAVSYDYYRIFYYVAKYGSFTQAAKVLMNNQPNITRAMNNLEAELNCRLFSRSRKGVALTQEGQQLFLHVEAAYQQLLLGEAELASRSSLLSGHLSLAISEIALHEYMLPILQQYKSAYPGIHIEILNLSTSQAVEATRRGSVDMSIVSTPTGSTDPLEKIIIRPFRDILIAGTSYAALCDHALSLRELVRYPIVCLGRMTQTHVFYSKWFAAHDLILKPDIEAATTDQILPMVRYGLGLGFVPEQFAKDAILSGDIVQVPLQENIPERHICLVRDKSRPSGAAASALFDLITSSTPLNNARIQPMR